MPMEKVIKDDKILFKMNIERVGDNLKVYVKTHPSVEEFFKTISDDKRDISKVIKLEDRTPAKFYVMTNGNDSELDRFFVNRFNDFGSNLMRTNPVTPNIALLRMVGISDGLTAIFPNRYSEESLEDYAKKMRQTIKELYVNFIRKVRITATLTVAEG
jgi:hypothetical protein